MSLFLNTKGFTIVHFDPCVFLSTDIAITIYVDDLFSFYSKKNLVTTLEHALHDDFEITDIGTAQWTLELRKPVGIYISQEVYAD